MKISCPHCGQRYELDDSFAGQSVTCERCWKDFVAFAPEPPPPEPVKEKDDAEKQAEPEKSVILCPYCESEIPQFVKKCRYCGEWLNERKRPKDPVVYVLLGIFCGLFGVHSAYAEEYELVYAHIAMTFLSAFLTGLEFTAAKGSGIWIIGAIIGVLNGVFILVELANCDEAVSRTKKQK